MNITHYIIYYIDKYNIFIFTTTEIRKWILKIWTKHYFITKYLKITREGSRYKKHESH